MPLLPLHALVPHPANANVMPKHLFTKLVRHIRSSGRYPPIIVRPHPEGTGYQILDGHHRAAALRELGHTEAHCIIWECSDHEALILLATLNRLQGQDDPLRRAELIAQLTQENLSKLATLLPETREKLERLLQLREPPPPLKPPPSLDDLPAPMHFFLLPADRAMVESALARISRDRNAALVQLCRTFLDTHPPTE